METARQIFARYFNQGISVNSQEEFEQRVIIPAMEDYARQQAQLAFEAARQTDSNTGKATFNNYKDYCPPVQAEAILKNEEDTAIQDIADSILPQYIPIDTAIQVLTFGFSTEGKRYAVNYTKDSNGYWQFESYKTV